MITATATVVDDEHRAEVPENLRPALQAWVDSGCYIAEGTGDQPSVSDFADAYQGCFDSFDDFAIQLAEDTGLLAGVPEDIARYFDWPAWIRDLAYDYTTEPDGHGGVHVFRNL